MPDINKPCVARRLVCSDSLRGAGLDGVDLRTLTLVDTLAGLESGSFTSAQLTAAFLAQIARYEGVYNAFTFVFTDALAQARASDARRAAGGPVGALEGVPYVIKEALNVLDYPATLGALLL